MKIAVIGAHGNVARHLVRDLAAADHEVVGIIRKEEQTDDVLADGGQPLVLDIETVDVAELTDAITTCDAVVFAAGAGGGDPSRTQAVDHRGAVKLADAAVAAKVPEYVMVSSMGTESTREGGDTSGLPEMLIPYLEAKLAAEDDLRGRDLAWTILRPGGLTDDDATGKVTLASAKDGGASMGSVPRADVAAVLSALLVAPSSAGLVLELTSGDETVRDAVTRVAG